MIEALRQVPGQLEVLLLVVPDRHLIGLVEQDVRGLQDRVGEQPDAGSAELLAGALVLELRHPAASPYPVMQDSTQASWACSGNWLWTKSVQRAGSSPHASSSATVSRVRARSAAGSCGTRDRVHVGDEVEGVAVVLHGHPVPDRAEVVAEVRTGAGRLDPGQHPRAPGRSAGRTTRHGNYLGVRETGGVQASDPAARDASRPGTVWDVIVVGGGPSGSAAALRALQLRPSARVAILDAADFPRDKACGDGIAPHGLEVLRDLGVHDAADGYAPIDLMRLRTPGGVELLAKLRSPAYVIPRKVFDERLVRAAVGRGAELIKHRVRSIERLARSSGARRHLLGPSGRRCRRRKLHAATGSRLRAQPAGRTGHRRPRVRRRAAAHRGRGTGRAADRDGGRRLARVRLVLPDRRWPGQHRLRQAQVAADRARQATNCTERWPSCCRTRWPTTGRCAPITCRCPPGGRGSPMAGCCSSEMPRR